MIETEYAASAAGKKCKRTVSPKNFLFPRMVAHSRLRKNIVKTDRDVTSPVYVLKELCHNPYGDRLPSLFFFCLRHSSPELSLSSTLPTDVHHANAHRAP